MPPPIFAVTIDGKATPISISNRNLLSGFSNLLPNKTDAPGKTPNPSIFAIPKLDSTYKF